MVCWKNDIGKIWRKGEEGEEGKGGGGWESGKRKGVGEGANHRDEL